MLNIFPTRYLQTASIATIDVGGDVDSAVLQWAGETWFRILKNKNNHLKRAAPAVDERDKVNPT
ncbi:MULTISPECIES: hypothetical protein [unclassified Thiocapsa]|uniref:hypothetical protein n=1 Tax=unclassified Thiocapsa TaxID=2641286 RepID=UPI0035AE0579